MREDEKIFFPHPKASGHVNVPYGAPTSLSCAGGGSRRGENVINLSLYFVPLYVEKTLGYVAFTHGFSIHHLKIK